MSSESQNESPKIFISYAWENQVTARQLQQALQAAAEVFVNYTGIQGGDSLPTRISEALRWCDTLILLWSQHAKDSHWVELEWTSVIALKRHLIPCKLDETPLPEILLGKRYVEFKNFDHGVNELLAALRMKKPATIMPVQRPILQLRSQSLDSLSDEAVKIMLKEYDFYCAEYDWNKDWCNPNGKGIKHEYELQHDGKIVIDHTTGLMWQQSGSPNYMIYVEAEKYIHDLNNQRFAGYNDWRLPTLPEVMSLMEPKKHGELCLGPIFERTQWWIWTVDKESAWRAWYVGFYYGHCYLNDFGDDGYVRVVRS